MSRLDQKNKKIILKILIELKKSSKITESNAHIQHGTTSVYRHSIAVAYYSLVLVEKYKIKVNKETLVRGALLHDYFLYDWHVKDKSHNLHGFRHPYTALKNANRDIELNEIEQNIIKRHMFPLIPVPPKYKESAVVCFADKVCSTYETLNLQDKSFVYKEVDMFYM